MIFSEGCNKLQAMLAKLAAIITPLIKGVFFPRYSPIYYSLMTSLEPKYLRYKKKNTNVLDRTVFLSGSLEQLTVDSGFIVCYFYVLHVETTLFSTLFVWSQTGSNSYIKCWMGELLHTGLWLLAGVSHRYRIIKWVWIQLDPFSTLPPPTDDT